jgi:hypothetical protein
MSPQAPRSRTSSSSSSSSDDNVKKRSGNEGMRVSDLISFMVTNTVVGVNLTRGWGSASAMKVVMPTLIVYNVIDSIICWKSWQHPKCDKSMMLHHLTVTSLTVVFYWQIALYGYTKDVYRLAYWLIMLEVSSVFFNLRNIIKSFALDVIFGVTFLTFRPVSTVMMFKACIDNRFDLIFAPFLFALTALNIHWSALLLKTLKVIKDPRFVPSKQACAVASGFPVFLVLVYNQIYYK